MTPSRLKTIEDGFGLPRSAAVRLITGGVFCILVFAVALLTASCPKSGVKKQVAGGNQPYVESDLENLRPILLYFYDGQATFMVPVTRYVSKDAPYPKVIFDELAKGPLGNSKLAPSLMPGTKVLDCSVDGGLLTVDLNGKSLSYGGGSVAELGLVLSVEYAARQIDGVEKIQMLFDGEKREFLPEGTGVGKPIPLPKLRNNFDPASDDEKIEIYLVLRDGGYIVPVAVSVSDSADLYKKLKDPATYGSFFDDGMSKLEFEFMETTKGKLGVSFEISRSLMSDDVRSAHIQALSYTVFSFVKAKPEYDSFAFDLEGEEVVTLFDVDVTKEGVEKSIKTINSEGKA